MQKLVGFWKQLINGNGLPGRRDFQPEDLARWMPHLFLIDVMDNDTLRYRLVGTGLVSALGYDKTNQFVDRSQTRCELDHLALVCRPAILESRAIAAKGRIQGSSPLHRDFELVGLPLADLQGRVEMLLGCIQMRGSAPSEREYCQLFVERLQMIEP